MHRCSGVLSGIHDGGGGFLYRFGDILRRLDNFRDRLLCGVNGVYRQKLIWLCAFGIFWHFWRVLVFFAHAGFLRIMTIYTILVSAHAIAPHTKIAGNHHGAYSKIT